MKEINIFTFLNQIQYKRKNIPYDKKIANAWMLTQWFSHDKELLKACNDINKYLSIIPDEVIYEYYMNIIPKGNRFIKWAKKRKEDEKNKKRINSLKDEYPELSTRECRQIINFLIKKGDIKINEN